MSNAKLEIEIKGLNELVASLKKKAAVINRLDKDNNKTAKVVSPAEEFVLFQEHVGAFTTPAEEQQKNKSKNYSILNKIKKEIDSA